MKKSLIWMLTVVMAITFGALLYFQIIYLENMIKMREEQFTESVMRSMHSTAYFLDRQETLHYLEKDVAALESSEYEEYEPSQAHIASVDSPVLGVAPSVGFTTGDTSGPHISLPPSLSPTASVETRFRNIQEMIRGQYLYQQGLIYELVMEILHDAPKRNALERADSTLIRNCLKAELLNNGLSVPFVFAVYDLNDRPVYESDGFDPDDTAGMYSSILFPNSDVKYTLKVEFPTKKNYIFSSVRFIIPTLSFSVILLILFLFTIIMIFRQKKLTEMKTDFINNMTHELKTPISTISLAAQMLGDASVRKSPSTLNHLSDVIQEESKRLRFQVEKVLQMSVLENSESALNFTEVNVNDVVETVVNTFRIKAERFGGSLTCRLAATNSLVTVDEMQFTNVMFSLLDNAIKYKKEDVPPHLEISTRNLSGDKIEIRIKDNGIGIKKDDLKRIFDKFYRVATGNLHNVKGFGLGLAYVKKMITLFDGNIVAESEPEVGSTFIITMPTSERKGDDERE